MLKFPDSIDILWYNNRFKPTFFKFVCEHRPPTIKLTKPLIHSGFQWCFTPKVEGRSKSVVMGIMSPSWAGLCPTTAMELEPVLIKPRLCSPTRRLDPPFSLMSFKLALGTTVL
ncbi:hypothetical protein EVAR_86687_1 [Eumeta japonica]|uniref:Uncharacterized protein n=1 Tax=Eumeta variegata TaxID=151549 RepID=A0A4C1XVD0_EUMVA|nr:hypothetical protein EVAR_86687_1 [Eumeta japonica]